MGFNTGAAFWYDLDVGQTPVPPGNETAWILTGPPVYPAVLLSRRFRGGECYKAWCG